MIAANPPWADKRPVRVGFPGFASLQQQIPFGSSTVRLLIEDSIQNLWTQQRCPLPTARLSLTLPIFAPWRENSL
jgi:hypothetical protein